MVCAGSFELQSEPQFDFSRPLLSLQDLSEEICLLQANFITECHRMRLSPLRLQKCTVLVQFVSFRLSSKIAAVIEKWRETGDLLSSRQSPYSLLSELELLGVRSSKPGWETVGSN
jgi:hypothetical protein